MFNYSISNIEDIKKYTKKDVKKIFLIVGNTSYKKLNIDKKIEEIFNDKNYFIYKKKNYFPTFEELIDIKKKLDEYNPDLIIAIGGGSVLDYAKISAVINFEKNLKLKIINNSLNLSKNYRLLAIPTTAGSGAEVTENAVIYIDDIKYSVEGPNVKPDDYLLIPDFISLASKKIKASAGFDAISQSMESIMSLKSNSISLKHATDSLKISMSNYLNYINNPSLENDFNMCIAANLSGKAISISKTTAPHAISYPFTSLYGINHGHAVALNLSKFLKFNFLNIKNASQNFDLNSRFNIIFEITKTKNINELTNYINFLAEKTDMELNFKKLGINIQKEINKILEGVNDMRLKNNPVKIFKKDITKIILD